MVDKHIGLLSFTFFPLLPWLNLNFNEAIYFVSNELNVTVLLHALGHLIFSLKVSSWPENRWGRFYSVM